MKIYFNILLVIVLCYGCTKTIYKAEDPVKIENSEAQSPLKKLQDPKLKPFYYGVASGDPLHDAVIIWTRIEPNSKNQPRQVSWQISKDSLFSTILKSGAEQTGEGRDYTVKVDVKNLEPNTRYFYRFISENDTSIVGRTMTAPKIANQLKFAVVSCSNYEWGYFNAYARLADEDLNAILHLGDYIYEYGVRTYGDTIKGRHNIPDYEILSLTDYRTRYAQYHLDQDLMAAHQNHPFIPIWDDHEISNNAYVDGAQNHQENEGDYAARKAIAKQVYYEWMPIRETENHYRNFKYGNLADIIMLDERLAGRTKQLGYNNPERTTEAHKILGDPQFNWLEFQLMQSESKWKVIGNQVIFSYQKFDSPNRPFNMDSWNGYPVDQSRLVNILRDNSIKNTIIVTGDTHSAWSFEVTDNPLENYDETTSEGAVAVEFGVASINSANHNESTPDSLVIAQEKLLMDSKLNPHLKYANLRDHGYLLLTLNDSLATAEYKIVPTNKMRNKGVSVDKTFLVKDGSTKLYSQDN